MTRRRSDWAIADGEEENRGRGRLGGGTTPLMNHDRGQQGSSGLTIHSPSSRRPAALGANDDRQSQPVFWKGKKPNPCLAPPSEGRVPVSRANTHPQGYIEPWQTLKAERAVSVLGPLGGGPWPVSVGAACQAAGGGDGVIWVGVEPPFSRKIKVRYPRDGHFFPGFYSGNAGYPQSCFCRDG